MDEGVAIVDDDPLGGFVSVVSVGLYALLLEQLLTNVVGDGADLGCRRSFTDNEVCRRRRVYRAEVDMGYGAPFAVAYGLGD